MRTTASLITSSTIASPGRNAGATRVTSSEHANAGVARALLDAAGGDPPLLRHGRPMHSH